MSDAAAGANDPPEQRDVQNAKRTLGSFLDLIQQTNSVEEGFPDDPQRSLNASQWERVCERIQRGDVKATCIIDFPYADAGNLNLEGGERLLERMYCFADGPEIRIVLHVHTIQKWGRRGEIPFERRADNITSVNVRHAVQALDLRIDPEDGKPYPRTSFIEVYGEEGGQRRWNEAQVSFQQEPSSKKFFLVPDRNSRIRNCWREYISKDRKYIEWSWRKHPVTPPSGEEQSAKVKKLYTQISMVLKKSDFTFEEGNFFESHGLHDTEATIRGGEESEYDALIRKPLSSTLVSQPQFSTLSATSSSVNVVEAACAGSGADQWTEPNWSECLTRHFQHLRIAYSLLV